MRPEDVEEILHSSGSDSFEALARGYSWGDCWTIEKDGAVVAMFGVSGEEGKWGVPWMLGTSQLNRCWSLLRECRQRLDAYFRKYAYLSNSVWAKNTVHVNWIKWLGFQFDGETVRDGETFLHFYRST
jgi:hypothetical protein